ncbi:hypothetical protein AAC387_Pa07g3091 [Persea americana]
MPLMKRSLLLLLPISICISLLLVGPTIAHGPHIITVRSPTFSPDTLDWDPSSQHFVVASSRHPSLHSVSDAGVLQTLISDPHLPPNSSVLAVSVDSLRGRLLAVIHTPHPSIAAYDLSRPPLHPRLFLSPLPSLPTAVAVDSLGNACVAGRDFISKIDVDGQDSIFSNSSAVGPHPINGIAYFRMGYFLAVQSGTGRMYKIDGEDGAARQVLLPKDLAGAIGIAIRGDGTAVVVGRHKAWFLKSDDGWAEAGIYDEIALDERKAAKGVAVREGKRVYVLFGDLEEGSLGNEEFRIEEVESDREKEGENVWMLVLIGFGLVYFLYWRFQMGKLVREMNKKRE